MVDLDRIQHRLELLAGYERELRRLAGLPVDEYVSEHVYAGLAGRLRGLAGMRNRLVHAYDEIDDLRVREAITMGLPDLDDFAGAIAQRVSGAG